LASERPITCFLVIAFTLAWSNMLVPLVQGWEIGTFTLVGALLGGLVGGAILVTAAESGRAGVHRLLAGVLRWRVHPWRLAVATGALPALTVVIAGLSGGLQAPTHGWVNVVLAVLAGTLVNTLVVNLWEEVGWTGFVQQRLMARFGVLRGSVLTAPAFAAIHWPLVFQEHGIRHTSARYALTYLATLLLLAPFFRYLVGMIFVDSGGSTLAAGLVHGSLNAAGAMAVVPDAWQHVPAVIALTLLLAVGRAARRRRSGR
jgi:membrane protease YdiL (CAAX protease family)